MKILITTDAFSPMINGVVTSTMNLYEELTNLGHDVRILALANDHHSRRVGNVYYIHSFGVRFYPNARATVYIVIAILMRLWNGSLILFIHKQSFVRSLLLSVLQES
nr:glycosyltransferase [Cellulosilyticum ruminicola]